MIYLLLPAYNEEHNLERLLMRVQETEASLPAPLCVLVIDDGSSDATAAVARRFGDRLTLDVVAHATNRGLAAAIKTGLGAALARAQSDDDIIITMDADDTHSPALLADMCARVREGHDIVVASRFRPGARVHGLTWSRQFFSICASLVFRVLAPMRGIRDYTCGYRAYRARFLRRVWNRYGGDITTESGFACMADILLKCRELDPVAAEVPMILRYDRKEGPSKMNVAHTVRDTLRLLLRSLVRRALL